VSSVPWFRARDIAMLGTDIVHIVGLVGMGLWLIDKGNLEELAQACAAHRRWEFLLTIAPLRLQHTTGSPVNPVALF